MKVYQNRLITSFLDQENNQELLKEYQLSKDKSLELLLDNRFKKFYRKYRLISYIIKVFHFESKHFDKKLRDFKNRYALETNVDGILANQQIFKIDTYGESSLSLKDHLTNEELNNEFSNLTFTQQKILTLSFLLELNDTEIAARLGVTQQSVFKTKKTALKKLAKREYCYV
ncbi:MAG: sigma-70 family RNA polymerase sigma factor [Lactobacillus sp.]|nr:sigma-70 family RNA polymerase sigma factor [Lactobacillus sp.]